MKESLLPQGVNNVLFLALFAIEKNEKNVNQ